MKVLLLTVAGLSSRFGRSVGRECLKCIYYERDYTEALLWQAIDKAASFDKIIVVGGYKFAELKEFTETYCKDFRDKIILTENKAFAEYGSGYSLYCGLKQAFSLSPDQIVFAEGDLWTDGDSFREISVTDGDCVTYNSEPIESSKSVVFYFDRFGKIKYLYDTTHNLLEINEPFMSVYNSGQIWKFGDLKRAKSVFDSLSERDWQGTNLVFVQNYFADRSTDEYKILPIKQWINCNTIDDFTKIGECENEKSR